MTGIILKYRKLIIALSIIISIAGILMLPGIKTDPDIRNYIPKDMVSRVNTDLIEKEFGVQDMVMILFRDSLIISGENLSRIKSVDHSISRLKGVDNTISLFSTRHIYSEDGAMVVDPAVKSIPRNSQESEALKEELSSNSLAIGKVVSSDFTTSVITVTIDKSVPEEDVLVGIDSVLADNPGHAQVFKGGLPYIRKVIMLDVRRDGLILIPLALLIMLAFLWIAFREWKGMVIPFTVVAMSIAVSMGLAPLLGWKMSIISLIVPIMLIAVANDYGIHMIAKYQEIYRSDPGRDMKSITREIVRKLRKPILFTGLTTVAGVLGLLTHSIIPARQVGVLTAFGVSFAILLTLFMVPAWLSMLKPGGKRAKTVKYKRGILEKGLAKVADTVTTHPVKVLLVSLFVTLIFSGGIFLVKVDSNQENFFPHKHPIRQAADLINSEFGGSQGISVMVEGDMKDPELLKTLERWSLKLGSLNGVGNVYSYPEVIREMSKGIYDKGEKGYDAIPDSRQGISQMLVLYNMNGEPGDFDKLVNYDYNRAQIIVMLNDPENRTIRNVLSVVDNMARSDKIKVTTGGYAYIMSQFSSRIVKGQVSSMLFALVMVMILLTIIFRSVRGGLVSIIPIIASLIFLLGFMGYSGIALNPATALLSSIMVGVGVDYTIHFIWRYKAELRESTYSQAIKKTLLTTGRGIIINALSVMVGFSVLVVSGFTSIRFFGYLILISIGVCVVAALLVIPSLFLIFKPSFVEPVRKLDRYENKKSIMHIMKKVVFIFLVLAGSTTLIGQTEQTNRNGRSATEILELSRQALKMDNFEAVSLLSITDSKGRTRERSNVTASKTYPDGTEKRIIRFLSPPDVEGTTVLINDHDSGDDEMWIYMPALRKTRRIVSSEKGKSFMGSEFSNSDMASPPAKDFINTFIDASDKPGYYRIESVPVSEDMEDEYGYSRKVSLISKTDYTISKMEFYNFDNELFKTIDIPEYKSFNGGKFMVMHMLAKNLSDNRSSEIVIKEVDRSSVIKDELFNPANLGR